MPKLKLATKIDRYYDMVEEVKILEARLKESPIYKDLSSRKEKLQEIEASIVNQHTTKELKFAKGRRALLEGKEKDTYKIVSRSEFDNYVYENHAFDLFQNRLTVKEVRKAVNAGEEIPGIQKTTKVSITVRGIE